MARNCTTLTERPELNNSIAALVYQVVAYYSIPFLLLLLLQGGRDGWEKVAAAVEIAYHAFNFFVALFIFREYLTDASLSLKQDLKRNMSTIWISVGLIFIVALVFYNLFSTSYSPFHLSALGALPLTEIEQFRLSQDVVLTYPLLGTLCMVILTPFSIGCLYYGAVFAPVCYTRPILAYFAMALFLAFPRYCNGSTFWIPTEQIILYITQLPMHIIACRAYQKTDSIWVPIAIHMIVNFFACGLILLFSLLGRM